MGDQLCLFDSGNGTLSWLRERRGIKNASKEMNRQACMQRDDQDAWLINSGDKE